MASEVAGGASHGHRKLSSKHGCSEPLSSSDVMVAFQANRKSGAVNTFVKLCRIAGSSSVDPARKTFAPRLKAALDLLDFKIPEDLASVSTEELGKCVAPFSRSEKICRDAFAAMEAARQFVSLLTTATIREWAKPPGSPVRFDVRRTGDELFVGRSEDNRSRVPLPPASTEILPLTAACYVGPKIQSLPLVPGIGRPPEPARTDPSPNARRTMGRPGWMSRHY